MWAIGNPSLDRLTNRVWPNRCRIDSKKRHSNKSTVAAQSKNCIAKLKGRLVFVGVVLVKVDVCKYSRPSSAFVKSCFVKGLTHDGRTEMPFPRIVQGGGQVRSDQSCPVTKTIYRLDLSV